MADSFQKNEQEQWKSFQSGNRGSFAWLYETYAQNLYNYGFKFSSDTTLIEDTIQDLFIRIWQNKERLKIPPSVKNYLLTAFRHLLFRKLSQAKRLSTKEMVDEKYLSPGEQPFEVTYIEKESRDIRYKQLQQALQQLTPRQKEALFLRFYEKASYEEIAQIMKISVKATYKIMARALQALKNNWLAIYFLLFTMIFSPLTLI